MFGGDHRSNAGLNIHRYGSAAQCALLRLSTREQRVCANIRPEKRPARATFTASTSARATWPEPLLDKHPGTSGVVAPYTTWHTMPGKRDNSRPELIMSGAVPYASKSGAYISRYTPRELSHPRCQRLRPATSEPNQPGWLSRQAGQAATWRLTGAYEFTRPARTRAGGHPLVAFVSCAHRNLSRPEANRNGVRRWAVPPTLTGPVKRATCNPRPWVKNRRKWARQR